MIRDDFSSSCWFLLFAEANSEDSADALIEGASIFTIFNGMMSYGPKNFENETFRLVTKGLRAPHHFTLPYIPRSNGGIKRLGKELLSIFWGLLLLLKMRQEEWPILTPIIQLALNHSRAPIKYFTGQQPSSPVSTFKRGSSGSIFEISDMQREPSVHLFAEKQ